MENYQGCKDNQNTEQKAKNYKLEEVCAATMPVEWVEKTNWVQYPLRNQDGSSQCVCMTLATEMVFLPFIPLNEKSRWSSQKTTSKLKRSWDTKI